MPTPIFLPDESDYWRWPDGTPILWGEEPQMTYTLAELTYMVARDLGLTQDGVATGGSTTTLVDTLMRVEPDDFWKNGTVWILRDAGGAGAAPENEYAVVTDFVQSTSTLTIQALTAAIAGGDRYACATHHVPLHILIQKINQALMELGIVPYADITTLTVENNKTEYSLPIAAKQNLREVYLETNKSVIDHKWIKLYNWEVQESDPGAAPRLILPAQYTAGYALKLVYLANHPALEVATAVLSENVPVDRVVIPAVLYCLEYRRGRTGWNKWNNEIARYQRRADEVKLNKPIKIPPKTPHIPMTNHDYPFSEYPGDRTPR